MDLAPFDYELPPSLIAQYPLAERAASRMLVLSQDGGGHADAVFRDLPQWLQPGDLLVFNDTRVLAARFHGRRASGGRIEVMLERPLESGTALARVRASHAPREGERLTLDGGVAAQVLGREGELFRLRLDNGHDWLALAEEVGHVPLPPYIRRGDEPADRERYQTVYARRPGAVAAPTAGLHFDETILERLERRGIERAFVTLHIGAGTFQPVRDGNLDTHRMHAERITVSADTLAAVSATRARGGAVVAVGTTVVRALETAACAGTDGAPAPVDGETGLFIRPGFRFRAVDGLLTNFHLPRSTLLVLVCAFAGVEPVLDAYRHAVAANYRFYSYGDAMLITPRRGPGQRA